MEFLIQPTGSELHQTQQANEYQNRHEDPNVTDMV